MQFQQAWTNFLKIVNDTIGMLPNLVFAIIIFFIFYIVARRIKFFVRTLTEKQKKARNAGLVLGKLAQSAVVTTGVLVVLPIVLPSFGANSLIQFLGIGSVAIGFAFHDIFQNFLAGILLLLTSPFHVGDEIFVDQYQGTVEDIQTRATTLRTLDGRRIVIPNSDLFTNSVTVYTAFRMRQIQYDLVIDYDEDIRQVKHLLLEAINDIEDVTQEPVAEILVTAVNDGGIVLRILCWTQLLHQAQILHLQDRVLTTVKDTLVANNIQLSMQTQKIFLESIRAGQNGARVEGKSATDKSNVT